MEQKHFKYIFTGRKLKWHYRMKRVDSHWNIISERHHRDLELHRSWWYRDKYWRRKWKFSLKYLKSIFFCLIVAIFITWKEKSLNSNIKLCNVFVPVHFSSVRSDVFPQHCQWFHKSLHWRICALKIGCGGCGYNCDSDKTWGGGIKETAAPRDVLSCHPS